MSLEGYLAIHLLRWKKNDFSKPIIRIAIVSVALGLACMILSLAIVTGFQMAIRDKVVGFGSHIQVTRFDNNLSFELQPISARQDFVAAVKNDPDILNIQVFATKPGIIKTKDQIEGIVLKGIGADYNWSFFASRVVEGHTITVRPDTVTDEVMISRETANRLYLKAGDPLRVYFIQEGEAVPRGRKFNIAGIYETGVGELDRLYVIGDIGVIRKLNNWETDQVGGFEILVKDFKKLDKVGKKIYRAVGYELNAKTIRDLYPQIFEWLGLMDMNAIIILVLMVLVSSMTMISTFLIIVLEKTGMIGILKALGARNGRISRLFLIQAGYILTLGLLWGNAVGIGLALIQKKWSVMKLPQDSYYVSVVPINLDWLSIAGLNLGTLIVCTAMMIIPSFIINRISPIKAIRFQ